MAAHPPQEVHSVSRSASAAAPLDSLRSDDDTSTAYGVSMFVLGPYSFTQTDAERVV